MFGIVLIVDRCQIKSIGLLQGVKTDTNILPQIQVQGKINLVHIRVQFSCN